MQLNFIIIIRGIELIDYKWEYQIIEKEASEFQKLLNQWRHLFEFEILWMNFIDGKYRALFKRKKRTMRD